MKQLFTAQEQLGALASSFPSLRDALVDYRERVRERVKDRTSDVDNTSLALVALVRFGKLGTGADQAAKFCLEVFNPRLGREDEMYRFELAKAVACWDDAHRAAFAAWAADPVLL